MAYQILKERKMPLSDAILVATAIGQHDEATGTAVDAVSAALILADKTDVAICEIVTMDNGEEED